MKTLEMIAEELNTDKKKSVHDYVSFYEKYFSEIKNYPLKIVEIGINNGHSLQMWYEYFPNSTIYGIDITDGHYLSNLKYSEIFSYTERIITYQADQGDKNRMLEIFKEIGDVDIIIEDGSHKQRHQQQNLAWLFPFLTSNGFYFIEDIYFSYCEEAKSCDSFIESETDTLTLPMIKEYIKNGEIKSNFMSIDEIEFIKNHTEFCRIEVGKEKWGDAECCVLKRKRK